MEEKSSELLKSKPGFTKFSKEVFLGLLAEVI
jgi:hypothetical protein